MELNPETQPLRQSQIIAFERVEGLNLKTIYLHTCTTDSETKDDRNVKLSLAIVRPNIL